jgi:hypothetical protein
MSSRVTGSLLIGIIILSGMILSANAATAYPGYIFTASGQNAYLISPSGATVHTWKATSSAQSNAYLLPDGSALFPITPATACPVRGDMAFPHGRIQQINWDNKVVWDAVVCDATFTPGYDLEPIANKDGTFTVLMGGATSTGGIKIAEVKPSGASGATVVWSYTLPDSLAAGSSSGGGMSMSDPYLNSIGYNLDLDCIVVDLNNVKKQVVIDHKGTGSILAVYKITTGSRSHAAKWVTKYFQGTTIPLPDANITAMRTNNILVVNNSIKAVEMNYNPTSKTLTWVKDITYQFAGNEGSVQRLPNGNTLVQKGMQSAAIAELDETGATVRTLNAPGSVARAYMYGPAYPGLKTYTGVTTAAPAAAATAKFTYNKAADIGKITIANSKGRPMNIRIVSLSGKTVYSASLPGTTAEFSTGRLLAGVYYIHVRHASGTFSTGFVKMP